MGDCVLFVATTRPSTTLFYDSIWVPQPCLIVVCGLNDTVLFGLLSEWLVWWSHPLAGVSLPVSGEWRHGERGLCCLRGAGNREALGTTRSAHWGRGWWKQWFTNWMCSGSMDFHRFHALNKTGALKTGQEVAFSCFGWAIRKLIFKTAHIKRPLKKEQWANLDFRFLVLKRRDYFKSCDHRLIKRNKLSQDCWIYNSNIQTLAKMQQD